MTPNTIFGGIVVLVGYILATIGKSREVPILKAFYIAGAICLIVGIFLIGIEFFSSLSQAAYWYGYWSAKS